MAHVAMTSAVSRDCRVEVAAVLVVVHEHGDRVRGAGVEQPEVPLQVGEIRAGCAPDEPDALTGPGRLAVTL